MSFLCQCLPQVCYKIIHSCLEQGWLVIHKLIACTVNNQIDLSPLSVFGFLQACLSFYRVILYNNVMFVCTCATTAVHICLPQTLRHQQAWKNFIYQILFYLTTICHLLYLYLSIIHFVLWGLLCSLVAEYVVSTVIIMKIHLKQKHLYTVQTTRNISSTVMNVLWCVDITQTGLYVLD